MNKQDPREYTTPIKECWAAHEVFRRLGFPPEDIYVATHQEATTPWIPLTLFVVLKTQGKEFLVTCGGSYKSQKEADAAFREYSEFINALKQGAFSEEQLTEVYEGSYIVNNSVQLLMALSNKGISCKFEFTPTYVN